MPKRTKAQDKFRQTKLTQVFPRVAPQQAQHEASATPQHDDLHQQQKQQQPYCEQHQLQQQHDNQQPWWQKQRTDPIVGHVRFSVTGAGGAAQQPLPVRLSALQGIAPVELVLDVLDKTFANQLLAQLLGEANSWVSGSWWFAGQQQIAPRSSATYTLHTHEAVAPLAQAAALPAPPQPQPEADQHLPWDTDEQQHHTDSNAVSTTQPPTSHQDLQSIPQLPAGPLLQQAAGTISTMVSSRMAAHPQRAYWQQQAQGLVRRLADAVGHQPGRSGGMCQGDPAPPRLAGGNGGRGAAAAARSGSSSSSRWPIVVQAAAGADAAAVGRGEGLEASTAAAAASEGNFNTQSVCAAPGPPGTGPAGVAAREQPSLGTWQGLEQPGPPVPAAACCTTSTPVSSFSGTVSTCQGSAVAAPTHTSAATTAAAGQPQQHQHQQQQQQAVGPWRPSYVLANLYRDGQQSVGSHTDRLSALGPLPTIASVSLGAGRVFRLHPVDTEVAAAAAAAALATAKSRPLAGSSSSSTSTSSSSSSRGLVVSSIDIDLPHNSLLIMWPPTQEQWKHEVPKCRQVTPHPLGGTCRINLTFRQEQPAWAAAVPQCRCNRPAIMRCSLQQQQHKGHKGQPPPPVQQQQQQCSSFVYYYACDNTRGPGCGLYQPAVVLQLPQQQQQQQQQRRQ